MEDTRTPWGTSGAKSAELTKKKVDTSTHGTSRGLRQIEVRDSRLIMGLISCAKNVFRFCVTTTVTASVVYAVLGLMVLVTYNKLLSLFTVALAPLGQDCIKKFSCKRPEKPYMA